jgi:HlyD family secretion protein
VKRLVWSGALLAGIAIAVALWRFGPQAPTVATVRLTRGSFRESVTTNGKVEPIHWAAARAEREGLVAAAPVIRGQHVAAGQVLAQLDVREAEADLASAQARIEESKAALATLSAGGARREIVEIEEAVKQKRQEKVQAENELAIAERLLARNAGTREEVRLGRDRVEGLTLAIQSLEAKRPALVGPADLTRAQARLREAETAAAEARRRMDRGLIRSPLTGLAYQVEVKPGAYLTPGALVALVGRTEELKVLVYVDEPELGRISTGLPVTITWDALPGNTWTGVVDKTPTQVVALGTRQVGEVECRIQNPGRELLPGTNVNVEIGTKFIASALLVPKDALKTENGEEGVYVLQNGEAAFRKLNLGPRNVSSAVVLKGLSEGDEVITSASTALKPGLKVQK